MVINLHDNDMSLCPVTIINDRYHESGYNYLAFNLDSWDVPKEINDDGMDYLDFFSNEGKQYIIGKGDTPQEALDDLKATLQRNRENPDENRFLFLDFEGIMKPGQQNAVENLRFIIEQTNCKIIVTSECRHGGYGRVDDLWKEYGIPMEYDSMTPIVSAPTYKDPVTGDVLKCDGIRRDIITPLEIVGWLHAHMTPFLTYAILDRCVKNLDHLVAIKKDQGLTRKIAEKVIWHLNTINN